MIGFRLAAPLVAFVFVVALLTAGVEGWFDVVRAASVALGCVAWWMVIQAATYRANLSENEYVRREILIKEFILAGFIALQVGTVYNFLLQHHVKTLISPITIVLYGLLIIVHLEYKDKRGRIDRNG